MENIAESSGLNDPIYFGIVGLRQACPISAHPEADLAKVISKVLEDREEPDEFDDKYLPAVLRQFSQETSTLTEASP